MTAERADSTRIFLSYRRDDVPDVVDRIADRLRERLGDAAVFVDATTITAGEKWQDALFSALYGCEVMVVVIGPNWMRQQVASPASALDDPNDFVRTEIEFALKREISIIPVLWGDATLPAREMLPAAIRGMTDYQAFTMRREHFDSDVRLLYERIESQVRLFATLGRRASSFVIDGAPPLLLNSFFGGTPVTFWILLVFYHWVSVGLAGRTLGKWIMGTKVASDEPPGRRWVFALARPLLGYPFVLASGIGTLQMVLHPQRVAVHDALFRMRVVQTRRNPVAGIQKLFDAYSRGFDEWLFKLLLGARLGFVIWWAKSFFGIQALMRLLERTLQEFQARKGGRPDIGTAAGAKPSAPVTVSPGLGGATVGPAGSASGSGTLVGAGLVGGGALAATAPPLLVGAMLALGSLVIYEKITPQSLSLVNPAETVLIDGQPVTATSVLVFADTSGSMGPAQLEESDTLIADLDQAMNVRRFNVYTGNVTAGTLGIWDIIDSVYTRGVDAVYIFSDFADNDDPALIDSLRQFLTERNLRLYLGTVGQTPDSLLTGLAQATGGGVVTHLLTQPSD